MYSSVVLSISLYFNFFYISMLLFSFSIMNRDKQKSELKYVVSLRPACDHMCLLCPDAAICPSPCAASSAARESRATKTRRPSPKPSNPNPSEGSRTAAFPHTDTHAYTHSHTDKHTLTHTRTRLGPQRQLRDTSPILVFVLILVPWCIRAHTHTHTHTHWFFWQSHTRPLHSHRGPGLCFHVVV